MYDAKLTCSRPTESRTANDQDPNGRKVKESPVRFLRLMPEKSRCRAPSETSHTDAHCLSHAMHAHLQHALLLKRSFCNTGQNAATKRGRKSRSVESEGTGECQRRVTHTLALRVTRNAAPVTTRSCVKGQYVSTIGRNPPTKHRVTNPDG